MSNPYLDHVTRLGLLVAGDWSTRHRLVRYYAWAIPNDAAIDLLVRHSPIVEMGAGTGYWAQCIHDAGGQITAFDEVLRLYPRFPIEVGGPEKLAAFGAATLLLCWPPLGTPMAADCLRLFPGQRVVYVGEGEGGCTADDAFHARLAADFELEQRVELPQWRGIHDDLTLWRRRPSPGVTGEKP